MKKQVKKVVSIVAAICIAATTSAFAAEVNDASAEVQNNQIGGISPYFIAISDCSRLLRLESPSGKMLCSGDTGVYEGYTAGVTVELQKYTGDWETIKTWNDKPGSTFALVSEHYYVARGTYQLKVTHRAYNSNGRIADTFVAYSDEVVY